MKYKSNSFIADVMDALSSVSDISYHIEELAIKISIDDICIGKIEEGKLYLLNMSKEFAVVEQEVLEDINKLIEQVTQSFKTAYEL